MIINHNEEISKGMQSTIKSLSLFHRAFKKTLLGMSMKRKQRFAQPKRKLKKQLDISITKINYMKVVNFSHPTISSEKHYVYLHGGAYLLKGMSNHYNFIKKIVLNSKANVSFIDYPVAGEMSALGIIDETTKVVKELIETYPDTSIIGDSAGGGLALTIQSILKESGINLKLFLMSPWVDLTMTNKLMEELEEDDFMFTIDQLLFCAKLYAKELSLEDSRVSPMYGDYSKGITIYAGTRDILFPDMLTFAEKFPEVTLHTYEGLPHVFPLLLGTNEAEEVIRDIIK